MIKKKFGPLLAAALALGTAALVVTQPAAADRATSENTRKAASGCGKEEN